jgi:ankyrin repeat protein
LAKKHTRKAVRKALENLPKGLDETYDEAMQRIYNQDEDDVQLAKKLLLWVSYSLRPLTVRELQHALAVELDDRATDEEALLDKTLMISVCAGIMTIDQESNVIRLVHYTTEDYFQRKRLDEFPTGQTSIAMTCLTYLSFDAFKVGYASDDEQMEARLKEYPLLQYAAQYWGIHATARAEPILQSQILKFLTLESNLSCSVQAMQLPSYRYNFYSQESAEWIPGLWVAAVFGLTEIVKALITPKTSLDMKTSHGETALYGAAAAGHEAVVRVLLENGADVNAEDKYNETALYGTAAAGHKAVVRVLLENGAEVNAGHKYNWTALHRAAAAGHEAVVRVLLENGIKVNVEYKYNWTALHGAAAAGYKAVVQVLLENGAEVNAKDEYRRTALHGAAAAGHETVVRMLLENGAEGNAKDEYGKRALYGAAAAEHEAVVRVLLKNGADVNAEDKYGRTALHGAAAAGHKGGGAGIARKRGGG